MEKQISLPILTETETRVMGALMEKSRTTPEYYPLTLNSLLTACNQKSARKPVVQYEEDEVVQALDSLRKKSLVATATGGGSRTIKYRHTLGVLFPLIPAELAILALLMLRGPLTTGEINSNSGRLYEFESLGEIQVYLEKLSTEQPAFIALMPRKSGQKEGRYVHLFSGKQVEDLAGEESGSSDGLEKNPALEARVEQLEQELAELKAAFDKLYQELMG